MSTATLVDHHRRREAEELTRALLVALEPFRPVDFRTYIDETYPEELRVRFAGDLVARLPLPVDDVLRGRATRADVVLFLVNSLLVEWRRIGVHREPNLILGEE